MTTTQRQQGWSQSQRRIFIMASNAAGWNAQQRYLAMHHVGCPLTDDNRPSVKHPRNSQRQFELIMAIAEGHAALREMDGKIPRPASHDCWRDVVESSRDRQISLLRKIHSEAIDGAPDKFQVGTLNGFIQRMTKKDDPMFGVDPPTRPEECDDGQLYRVIEGYKAWAGRELIDHGVMPRCFRVSRAMRQRALSAGSAA